MAIARSNIPFDATWMRAWEVDTFAELDTLAFISAPLGPKRGDMAFCAEAEPGAAFIFVNPATYVQFTGFATLPVDLATQVAGRLPYANYQEISGPALLGNPNPGVSDPNQFQPNNAGDVLQYDGTDLIFTPITDNALFYETGTWTPVDASGASLSFSNNSGDFVRIGDMVFAGFRADYPATANGLGAKIGGLPFTAKTGQGWWSGQFSFTTVGANYVIPVLANTVTAAIFNLSGSQVINSALSSAILTAAIVYRREP